MIWIIATACADSDNILLNRFEGDTEQAKAKLVQMARREAEYKCEDMEEAFKDLVEYCPEKAEDIGIFDNGLGIHLSCSVGFSNFDAEINIAAFSAPDDGQKTWYWAFFNSDSRDIVFGCEGALPTDRIRRIMCSMIRSLKLEDDGFEGGSTSIRSICKVGKTLTAEATFQDYHCNLVAARYRNIPATE